MKTASLALSKEKKKSSLQEVSSWHLECLTHAGIEKVNSVVFKRGKPLH